jgi:hypothetical protein
MQSPCAPSTCWPAEPAGRRRRRAGEDTGSAACAPGARRGEPLRGAGRTRRGPVRVEGTRPDRRGEARRHPRDAAQGGEDSEGGARDSGWGSGGGDARADRGGATYERASCTPTARGDAAGVPPRRRGSRDAGRRARATQTLSPSPLPMPGGEAGGEAMGCCHAASWAAGSRSPEPRGSGPQARAEARCREGRRPPARGGEDDCAGVNAYFGADVQLAPPTVDPLFCPSHSVMAPLPFTSTKNAAGIGPESVTVSGTTSD